MGKVIVLDNGHGDNTPGKRSPDWSLLEWKYTRQIVKRIYKKLTDKGYDIRILVPEDHDIDLNTRCKRVNKIVDEYGRENVILISVHINAMGNGESWMKARGWQVHTYTSPSNESKEIANILFDNAKELGLKVRQPKYDQKYWMNDFWILKKSKCPAVLTENLFQDNKQDVEFLLSECGKNTITNLHVNAILNIIKKEDLN